MSALYQLCIPIVVASGLAIRWANASAALVSAKSSVFGQTGPLPGDNKVISVAHTPDSLDNFGLVIFDDLDPLQLLEGVLSNCFSLEKSVDIQFQAKSTCRAFVNSCHLLI